jgi:hypothetical protein
VYLRMNIAIMEAQMPPNEKLVLLALAAHYNGPKVKNLICPGLDRLHSVTGLSPSSVKRAVAWLSKRNCITVTRRFNSSNVYTLARGIIDLPRCIGVTQTPLTESDEVTVTGGEVTQNPDEVRLTSPMGSS